MTYLVNDDGNTPLSLAWFLALWLLPFLFGTSSHFCLILYIQGNDYVSSPSPLFKYAGQGLVACWRSLALSNPDPEQQSSLANLSLTCLGLSEPSYTSIIWHYYLSWLVILAQLPLLGQKYRLWFGSDVQSRSSLIAGPLGEDYLSIWTWGSAWLSQATQRVRNDIV